MYYYKQVIDKKIVSVGAKSQDAASSNFVKATKSEYDNFISSLPVVVTLPQRDLATEIDELKTRLDKLTN